MGKHNTGSKGAPVPNMVGTGMPGHGKVVSSVKMYSVNSVGRNTTSKGATGASNKGVTKAGRTPNGSNSVAMKRNVDKA